MSAVFRLQVLPAGIGDALVLDYGSDDDIHRVIIDGGVTTTADGVTAALTAGLPIELLMVSHIDNDHIAGMLKALAAAESADHPPVIGEVWFNGFRHLPQSPLESMGPVEGERMSTLIIERGLAWNTSPPFEGGAIMIVDRARPPVAVLPGGLRLTLLSPGHDELNALRKKWLPVVEQGGLDPHSAVADQPLEPAGRLQRMGGLDVRALAGLATPPDRTEANGSSIAVIAEWMGRTALLTGDAHAEVLLTTLSAWLGDRVLEVDVFKLPHHGSKANVTAALLEKVKAKTYIFSSSGEGRSQHPNDQAVARVIAGSTGARTLAFNYRNERTSAWDEEATRGTWGYRTRYPLIPEDGLVIDLLEPGSSG